jgi:hypothetical protein
MKSAAFSVLIPAVLLSSLAVSAHASSVLGAGDLYAVLAGTTVTNVITSPTAITGSLGVSPGSACTGFTTGCTPTGAGTVSGTIDLADGASGTAVADESTAYIDLANTTTPTPINEGTDSLGSLGTLESLGPGVYVFTGSDTELLGTLTLAGDGNSNDLWIFQFPFAFIAEAGSSIVVTNTGANAGVYFEVGSQATLDTDAIIQGNILAGTAIVFDPGAQITCGRAFAESEVSFAGVDTSNGMESEVVSSNCSSISSTGFNGGTISAGMVVPGPEVSVPEPGTFALLSLGLLAIVFLAFRKRPVSSLI